MNMQELIQLSYEELSSKLIGARQELFSVTRDVVTGKEKNSAQLKGLRRDVARIFTAMKAKQAK